MSKYDHNKIEKKWQAKWEKSKIWQAPKVAGKKKFYALIEFPYPSGSGLHVGHVRSNTAMDIISHKRRAEGYDVLYPIGWDAFGLPTENYAIKTGIHPAKVTKQNTDTFRKQLKRIGFSFDWSREINTTDPEYYKWTQWIFLQMYKKGLAYKSKMPINWCPVDKIGLANEEVVDGCCERCGSVVEKREKEQWMLAITKYAERLYNDLDGVEYLEKIKTQQRNWIGKSEGAEINFAVTFDNQPKAQDGSLAVFTTRPDTLFGATYLVLAPDHLFVTLSLTHKGLLNNEDAVRAYAKAAKNKPEIERTAEGKEKTGVRLEGIWAINPANKEKIPVYIADYVLAHYGTGAIMAVPAHDQRDNEFAKKFDLPIRQVIEPTYSQTTEPGKIREGEPFDHREAIIAVVKHWSEDKYIGLKWKQVAWGTFITGGIEKGQTPETAAKAELLEEVGYKNARFVKDYGIVHGKFYHVPKKTNRNSHAHMVYLELENDERVSVDTKEEAMHEVMWLTKAELAKFLTADTHQYFLKVLSGNGGIYTDYGTLSNSSTYNRMESAEAMKKIVDEVGGKMITTFKLRDWVFSRQRYWGEPIPMIRCEYCGLKNPETLGWIPVPEKDLPVKLPNVKKYEPTDDGESPLSTMEKWLRVKCPQCKNWARRETDTMPNWAGSSWYFLRYVDPKNKKALADKTLLKKWTPVDWYNGGMEHTTLHLLYSRFWHKFLYDLKLVPTSEPYIKRTSHGLILAEGGAKMSKSKGNALSPDEIIKAVGADTLRVYEMFMGPFGESIAWNTNNMVGVKRFLDRIWRLQDIVQKKEVADVNHALHVCIQKVGGDIEEMKFNTAVSAMMVFVNEVEKKGVGEKQLATFLRILAPFAPHITEEMWSVLGNKKSIHLEKWPKADKKFLAVSEVTIMVSINGKMREQFRAATDTDNETLEKIARTIASDRLKDQNIIRVIVVPNKLVNFVIK
ncbi:MAG: leucine--tRNA ligase [Candidatus Kaiserbacteria bacterium]|nr:leucine--tRNA ligase [Candidatus Kaiserbacteria bacterium]